MLYRITGDVRHRQAAETVGTWLLEVQDVAGFWDLGKPYGSKRYTLLDITAEFVVWLAEIVQHLESRG